MTDIIEQLAEALANHIQSPIPLSVDLWSVKEIAAYLKQNVRNVCDRVVTLPGFPQAIRIPTQRGTKGYPRWKAVEVIEWVEKYQEKRAA